MFLFNRYRQLQAASDSRITELQSDLKVKQFELDRLQILYEETSQSLKQVNVDNAKYQGKLEVSNVRWRSMAFGDYDYTRMLCQYIILL